MNLLTINKIVQPLNIEIQSPVWMDLRRMMSRNLCSNISFEVLLSDGTDIQRGYVWTLEQKQELIMSCLKEIQLPNIIAIFHRDTNAYSIVDGKQRLSTIFHFISGNFPLVIDGKDYYFSDLDEECRRRVYRPVGMNWALIWDDGVYEITDKDLVDLYQRLNYSGTPQELDHLNKIKSKVK